MWMNCRRSAESCFSARVFCHRAKSYKSGMNTKPVSFTIATFNMRRDVFFDGRNRWKYRYPAIAEYIRHSGIDIIGTQELTSVMKGELAALLPGYTFIGHGRSRRLGGEHTDIIVRDDCASLCCENSFWLSKRPDRPGSRALFAMLPRICTVAELKLHSSGQRIRVFNTHFDHLSRSAKMLGIRVLLRFLREADERETLPTVITGDLNFSPTSKMTDMLCRGVFGLRSAFDGDEGTLNFFRHGSCTYRCDHIFISGEFIIQKAYIDRFLPDGRLLSDHYPLVASLAVGA